MKLYLSSYRIPTPAELVKLLGREPAQTRTAVIPNAQDYYIDRVRRIKIRDVTTYLETLRFINNTIVDLRDYTDPEKLQTELQTYDLLWVMGGNTFCLSYEMQRSGFGKIIKDALSSGVVYGGESAGALMAGNSLKGVEFADEPAFAEKVVRETLNLTPHFILPHADNQAFAEAITGTRALHKNDPTIIELADNQALVINGTTEALVPRASQQ